MASTPKNYLNNKDMLLEIHRSKSSYCSFTDPTYHQYDIILPDIHKINNILTLIIMLYNEVTHTPSCPFIN